MSCPAVRSMCKSLTMVKSSPNISIQSPISRRSFSASTRPRPRHRPRASRPVQRSVPSFHPKPARRCRRPPPKVQLDGVVTPRPWPTPVENEKSPVAAACQEADGAAPDRRWKKQDRWPGARVQPLNNTVPSWSGSHRRARGSGPRGAAASRCCPIKERRRSVWFPLLRVNLGLDECPNTVVTLRAGDANLDFSTSSSTLQTT